MIEHHKLNGQFAEVVDSIVDLLTEGNGIAVQRAVDQWTNAMKFIVTRWPEENG